MCDEMRSNVSRMMWFCALYGIASSIALMGLFDAYLFIKSGGSNSSVGLAESVSGLTQVLVVFPAGYIADRFSRSKILAWCSVLSLFYVSVSCCGVWFDESNLIYASLVIGGVYAAVQNSTSFALFADSVPQGMRAVWMARVAVVTQIAMGSGPAISLLMLHYLGDNWDLSILHIVLVSGFLMMVPANMFLQGWKDIPAAPAPVVSSADHPLIESVTSKGSRFSYVPYMICLNDIITCIGAGMTVKFFPLFFKNDYGLSPVQLQALFTVYCLAFALCTWLCERIASRIGRVQSSLIFSISGVACLFSLAYLENLVAVIVVFILRGALQNSIYPIDRSIIMDFVPSDQRGRWNSIESISAMTWSGSAVLGGFLMDSHDYRYTFVITAWIYLAACALRVPLLWLVPKREKFVQAKIFSANEEIMKSPIASSPLMFSQ
jgi:MFS family permease